MKGFILKATYISGPHKGKEYFELRTGYIRRKGELLFPDEVFTRIADAKRSCTSRSKSTSLYYDPDMVYSVYDLESGWERED